MKDKVIEVPFYNTTIVAVEKNGQRFVAMKPLVEAMGLDWSKQLRQMKDDHVLSSTMDVTSIVGADGKNYKMVCLPIEYLNGWLFKISANRYTGDKRKVIELYQKECYHALYGYWHNGGAINPRIDNLQAQDICKVLQTVCDRLDENNMLIEHMNYKNRYLTNFEPQGRPYSVSNVTGRPKSRYVRGYWTSNVSGKEISNLHSKEVVHA